MGNIQNPQNEIINPVMSRITLKTELNKQTRFTIREMANEFGVTARTLRFYESKGLLSPERNGRARIYKRRDRARLKLVLQGKRVGFSLVEIREMMDLYDLRDGQKTQLRFSLDRFSDRIRALEIQKHDIEQAITDLQRTCSIVKGLLEAKPAEHQRQHGELIGKTAPTA